MLKVLFGVEFRVLHLILESTMRIYKVSMGMNILREIVSRYANLEVSK